MYWGDIRLGDTLDIDFTTINTSGVPTSLSGGTLAAYVGNSTTEITAGITLTADFDARTGLNHVRVVASSGNGYATASTVRLVLTAGTVSSASVVGYVVGSFSIENRSALMPATAARTLVVDAAGLADANMVKAGPTGSGTAQTARDLGTSVLLSSGTGTGQVSLSSGTVTVGTNNDKTGYSLTQSFPSNFASLAIDSSGRVNAFLIGILTSVFTEGATGRIAAAFKQFFNIATPAATMDHGVLVDTVTTATTATNVTNAPTAGDFTATMKTSLNSATPAVTVSDKTGFSLSAAGVQAIWDALTSALTTVGSIGKRIADYLTGDAYARLGAPAGASVSADVAAVKVDTAAIKAKTDNLPANPASTTNITAASGVTLTSAYDPAKTASQAGDAMALTSGERTTLTGVIWAALTSGLTTVGSIGKWIVDKIDVVLSTRLASSGYTAPLDAAGTRSAVGLASANVDTQLGAIAGYIDTEVGAIKAKTDNLPVSPAATGDAMTLTGAYDAAKTAAQAGDAMALTSGERSTLSAALLDLADAIETGVTLRQSQRLMLAALAGKISGAGSTTVTIRNAVADSKDRIVATVDSNGDRIAITTDLS